MDLFFPKDSTAGLPGSLIDGLSPHVDVTVAIVEREPQVRSFRRGRPRFMSAAARELACGAPEPVVGRIDNSIRRAVLVEPGSWRVVGAEVPERRPVWLTAAPLRNGADQLLCCKG